MGEKSHYFTFDQIKLLGWKVEIIGVWKNSSPLNLRFLQGCFVGKLSKPCLIPDSLWFVFISFEAALTQSIKRLMDFCILHTCIRNGGGEAVVIGMDWICCCRTTEGTLLRELRGIPEFWLHSEEGFIPAIADILGFLHKFRLVLLSSVDPHLFTSSSGRLQ